MLFKMGLELLSFHKNDSCHDSLSQIATLKASLLLNLPHFMGLEIRKCGTTLIYLHEKEKENIRTILHCELSQLEVP